MADLTIDNNGTLEDLEANVAALVLHLNKLGFQWIIEQDTITSKPLDTLAELSTCTTAEEMQPLEATDFIGTPTPLIVPEKVSKPDEIDMMLVPEGAVNVLDHGYVSLMDVFGTDDDIAEAARLSYGRGTKKVNKNAGLINYLYSHAHTSPFEMVEMKFQMRLPIFVMRQWVRHRTANLNEYSGRYSIMPRLWYTPNPEDIKLQDLVNKQGSSEALEREIQEAVAQQIWETSNFAFNQYEDMIHNSKVSREMARIVLPLNTYTEIVWKMDLNNMLKFLWLRDDSHAQPEIQAFARVIAEMVKDKFPLTYAAYQQSRQLITFTRDELLALMTGDRSKLSKSQTAKSMNVQEQIKKWLIEDATN
jgi:thymidylate synthase (FAD)